MYPTVHTRLNNPCLYTCIYGMKRKQTRVHYVLIFTYLQRIHVFMAINLNQRNMMSCCLRKGEWNWFAEWKQKINLSNYPSLYVCIYIISRCALDKLRNCSHRYHTNRAAARLRFCRCNLHIMTSSIGNIFRVTGPLCWEFTGPRWIPHTRTSDAELWCFLWSASE